MDKLKLTRIYADAQGGSHFQEVDVALKPTSFAPPAPPTDLSSPFLATRSVIASSPPGYFGDWHHAPGRQLAAILSGEMEAETSDGDVRRFGPGALLLAEDTTGTGHCSRVVSQESVVILFVQLAE